MNSDATSPHVKIPRFGAHLVPATCRLSRPPTTPVVPTASSRPALRQRSGVLSPGASGVSKKAEKVAGKISHEHDLL